MISLLIGVSAFLLAVIASVTIDLRPCREDRHDHAMDVTTLTI